MGGTLPPPSELNEQLGTGVPGENGLYSAHVNPK